MPERQVMRPNKELVKILERAYSCSSFYGTCKSACWNPEAGFIPRGYLGATNTIEDVEVVFVLAEPGDPHSDECYESFVEPVDYIDTTCQQTFMCLKEKRDHFHKNLRFILDQFFPGVDFIDQISRSWITQSVLCSASVESGNVPIAVSRECRSQFLDTQLKLFPNATKVALGSKARERLKYYPSILVGGHPAPPGCNHHGVRQQWLSIANQFRKSRARRKI